MSKVTKKQENRLKAALPVMRDYIIHEWWATARPVRASRGDGDVRTLTGFGTLNAAGWWGRAWTACEADARRQAHRDAWMREFKDLFTGLRRSVKQPYEYEVSDVLLCPAPARLERKLAEASQLAPGETKSPMVRLAIERAGMQAAKDWLLANGYQGDEIKDTSATKAWDYEVTRKGSVTLYVEAKGMVAPWGKSAAITVTRNEVENARRNPDSCVLIVATSCTLSQGNDGQPVAKPGKILVEYPWTPDAGALEARVFTHRPRRLR
ncbi:MAG: hypothetical protein KA371_12170 [Acidobacteria bacterium]|nr:hypothetical protein [Acidobacteriota bacterium]